MKRIGFTVGLLVWAILTMSRVVAAPVLEVQNSLVIPPHTVNGIKISELSGLAWDQDEQLLYALSDKGAVFHFRLDIQGNKLKSVEAVYAATLTDKDGERIKKGRRDSEGLTLINASNGKIGDSELVIAFEGIPRLIRFTPQGKAIKNIELPNALDDKRAYQHGNDSLESVTIHPRYGFVTAPEMPLKGEPRNRHTLYTTKGQQWSFNAYPAKNSGISALEVLPNGNLLVMERAWSGLLNPLVVSLRYLDLQQCANGQLCVPQELQVLSSHLLVDNYEGLTHIQGNQYVIVSDDGDEDFLPTTLTLFTLDLGK